MASLASFLPILSSTVEMSEAALYERQRALVRAGVLPKASGRGRASGGARATPETVTWLLLSLLATDNLSAVIEETPKVAKSLIGKKSQRLSPFKKDSTLLAAMTMALGDSKVAERISEITVYRKLYGASVVWIANNSKNPLFPVPVATVTFLGQSDLAPGISVRATIFGQHLVYIANAFEQEEWR